MTNMQLKKLDNNLGQAILKSCDEIIKLKLIEHFPLSVWQTGSGTHTNMNANEVISNRSIQLLKGKIGSKKPVHPNDHVNMSQSSNDVFPTVMHISCIFSTKNKLIPAINNLIDSLTKKQKEFKDIIKVGRTHTQDATPISLGQVFSGYREQIINNKNRLNISINEIYYLAQGGTAVGTGINAPKKYDINFCKNLSKITKINFFPAKNKFESIAAHDSLVNFSSTLNGIAVSLIKICNDIRLLASGPRAGINELILPDNEPGSSIMPGKVNPTQIEALTMVCAQLIGNNSTISFSGNHSSVSIAGSQGNFELNAYKPVIIYNLLQSINILGDAINSFSNKCLKKIKPNKSKIKENVQKSLMLVTALNPHIGYENSAKIAKLAFKKNLTLKEAAIKLKLIDKKKFDKIVNIKKMV